MYNLVELLKDRNNKIYWHGTGTEYSPSLSPLGLTDHEVKYTNVDLAAVDPRLVEIAAQNWPTFSNTMFADALDYWSKPLMWLPKTGNFGKIIGQHAVKQFESFTWTSPSSDVVVQFICYDLTRTANDTYYPDSAKKYQVEVPRYWMDEHYPKWDERYLLAKSLELDPVAMTALLIEPIDPTSNVSIESVKFD